MNDEQLTQLVGEHLKDGAEENALNHLELMRFMTRNAPAELWGKADQAGLKPGPGQWVVFMNQHRTKRAATEAEAEEIVRLHQERHGAGCDCYLITHALTDPVWALHGFRHVAKHCGQMKAEI